MNRHRKVVPPLGKNLNYQPTSKNTNNKKILYLIKKYNHAWVLLYLFIYAPWFIYLEKTVTTKYTPIHIGLDDLVPFNEFFVIPYYLWFAYVAIPIALFFFTSKEDFYKTCAFLFIGMTICLTIYTIWPNGQDLRPTTFARNNMFVNIVKKLYGTDTCTNVCPSIHVFNSIGIHIAIAQSKYFKNKRWLRHSSLILCVLICLSTVFLKQHSVFDGIAAIILSVVMYLIVYVPDYSKLFRNKDVLTNSHTEA